MYITVYTCTYQYIKQFLYYVNNNYNLFLKVLGAKGFDHSSYRGTLETHK